MRNDGVGAAKQRDVVRLDVAAMGSKQPRRKVAMSIEIGGRRHTVMLEHEVHLGAALRQVDGVAQIAFVGKRADRLEQFGR